MTSKRQDRTKHRLSGILSAGILLSALLLTACVKDELHDTPHPDHGKVTVTADWTERGEGVAVPALWTVSLGDYTGEETTDTHAPDCLFVPGSYTLAAYNTPEHIRISGTTATVDADAESTGYVSGTPGWLFTSVQEVAIAADTDYSLTAVMHQQVRELTLVIEPEGDAAQRIVSVAGTLSGVAGTLDFSNGTHGTPSSVALAFTPITEGTDAGKWTATVRLLGIAGDVQRLTGTIVFADGNPGSLTVESDLTTALVDFNSDKTHPLTLGGTIVETPAEAGVSATISDWNIIMGNPVEAM